MLVMDEISQQKINKEMKDLNTIGIQQMYRAYSTRISGAHSLLKCTQNIPQDRRYGRPQNKPRT